MGFKFRIRCRFRFRELSLGYRIREMLGLGYRFWIGLVYRL